MKSRENTIGNAALWAPVFLIVLLSGFLAPLIPLASVSIVILVATALVLALVRTSLLRPRGAALFSPIGLLLAFMAAATGLVPILWGLGWADPWVEIQNSPYSAAAISSLAFMFLAAGVLVGRPSTASLPLHLMTSGKNLNTALVAGAGVGLVGYFALAALAGGPTALLHSLADRRELLAGTGPLRILLVVSAVACVYGVLHLEKTAMQIQLTWACGLVYVATTLLTGSRFQAIVVVVAIVCASVRINGIPHRVRTRIFAIIAVTIPLSTFYGSSVRSGLTYGKHFDVIDSSSWTSTINSLVSPFVGGGLDVIRTTGVLREGTPSFRFDLGLFAGSIGNLVPRSVWPGKPNGSATQFSERYFPDKWAQGTGVPPSISAEMLHSFGLIGGLVALFVFGFVFTRLSYWAMGRAGLWWALFVPFLAADSIQLAKSGSDGFLRTIVIHIAAATIMVAIAQLARTQVLIQEPPLLGNVSKVTTTTLLPLPK
jgi:oligosaccharide repeat unit polymerase